MDETDRKLLEYLQSDTTLSISDLSDRIGLSQTPCWRRIQNLENQGVIRKRVALLDRVKLNVGVTVFVSLKTNQHSLEWLTKFNQIVTDIPEVLEFYRMSGGVDYLLKVVVPDIAAYDAVYKRLIERIDLFDVSSAFAMEEIKCETKLPLEYSV
ncbi:MAG: Lrp/AsnC family transcriptional regulator [Gammaproteobacteria bacterium]|jgi:Lrp/AsnC family transcriptional regulator|nr:Lrp/AsnC family transcriptional regulator [Gammaproteobacteria bacterium]